VHRRVEVGADVLSGGDVVPVPRRATVVVAAISRSEKPAVFANGGGSWMTGVRSDSGAVRSTTSTAPPAMAASRLLRTVTPQEAT
jgi:hypothetical protein